MRAVALSNPEVQDFVASHFVPLQVSIDPGTRELPLDWPALLGWRIAYAVLGGEQNQGFTACSVVSPDVKTEYANTGSALIWELFDSPAYDAAKFLAMVERGQDRFEAEQRILSDRGLSDWDRWVAVSQHRAEVRRAIADEGRLRPPPPGFTKEHAEELLRLSGDLP